MTSFIIRRLLYAIPMLVLVSLVSFVIINLPPGDYLTTMRQQLESQAGLTREEAMAIAERMAARYGLDRPFMVQYFEWIKGIVTQGDFVIPFIITGRSTSALAPVGLDLLIATTCHAVSVGIGVLVGIFSATHKYSFFDNVFTVLSLGLSTPNFFLALLIMYYLAFM